MTFFVYIIYSSKCDKYFVGHTDSIERQIEEHNMRRGGKFSNMCFPWEIVYKENYKTLSEAIAREKEIIKKSRKYIETLIGKSS